MNFATHDTEPSPPNDAHQIALELLKQIITLGSGVLALSATFINIFKDASPYIIAVLVISWICLIFSILLGIEAISAIVKSRLSQDFDWSEGTGKKIAGASKYMFVAGIALFALFALLFLLFSGPK